VILTTSEITIVQKMMNRGLWNRNFSNVLYNNNNNDTVVPAVNNFINNSMNNNNNVRDNNRWVSTNVSK
jgi:hypothetical protein